MYLVIKLRKRNVYKNGARIDGGKMKKSGKKQKIFMLIVVVLLLIVGIFLWSPWEKETPPLYTLGEVKKGTMTKVIDATGTIEAIKTVDLSATASGTLEHVYVKQNEVVHKGQILADISSKSLTSIMKEAENTLRNKESHYQRLSNLYDEGAISFQMLDDAKLAYLNAKEAYDKAKADVHDTVIVSPMDGVIIGEPMKSGETVSQGLASQMVIASVADLSAMKIKLLVDETDIGAVKVGQKVDFTVDAYSGKTYHGIVTDISKKENTAKNQAGNSSVVYYPVYVSVNDDEIEGLYPSMTARAEITGNEISDALIVPVGAIRSDAKGSYVYKNTDQGLSKVYIDTGMTTDTDVQVLSGLEEHDEIVVGGTLPEEMQMHGKEGATVVGV